MNRQKLNKLSVIALALTFHLSAGASWFQQSTAPQELANAHDAYLNGKNAALVEHLKETFIQHDQQESVRHNALSLLERAFESNNGRLPANWHLPLGVKRLKAKVRRTHRRGPVFHLKITGELESPGLIKQLKVTRFPNEVIVDKLNGIGEWDEYTSDRGEHEFELAGEKGKAPVPAGLYFIDLEMSDGQLTNGYFLLDRTMNSSRSPIVHTPSFGEHFKTKTPTFQWNDFYSPQYRTYERRSLWTGVSRMQAPDYEWNTIWSQWEGDPKNEQITVGKKLKPGRYLFVLAYQEKRYFGPMTLSRQSNNIRPFYIR